MSPPCKVPYHRLGLLAAGLLVQEAGDLGLAPRSFMAKGYMAYMWGGCGGRAAVVQKDTKCAVVGC